MMATALFWMVVLVCLLGVGSLWCGMALMVEGDDRSGLPFVSCGAGLVLLCLGAVFWRF